MVDKRSGPSVVAYIELRLFQPGRRTSISHYKTIFCLFNSFSLLPSPRLFLSSIASVHRSSAPLLSFALCSLHLAVSIIICHLCADANIKWLLHCLSHPATWRLIIQEAFLTVPSSMLLKVSVSAIHFIFTILVPSRFENHSPGALLCRWPGLGDPACFRDRAHGVFFLRDKKQKDLPVLMAFHPAPSPPSPSSTSCFCILNITGLGPC